MFQGTVPNAPSKLIIDAHHGEIGYRRVEGKATVFYFILPENQEATTNSAPA